MGKIRTNLVYGNPRYEICAVCDVDFDAAKQMAELYSTIAFQDFKNVIQYFELETNLANKDSDTATSSKLDAVIISVPTRFHCDYIRQAAKYKLAVFVEKPVADSPQEIEELYTMCESQGVPLCCGFQRRFDKSYVAAAEAVQQGEIGQAISAHIFFGDSPGPPLEFLITGGNIFFDLSVHDVDFIRWALNDNIASVYAKGTSSSDELRQHNVQDNATMMMTTTKGSIVTLTMSRRAAYGYDQRCEIFGDQGKVVVGNEFDTTTITSNRTGDHRSRLKNSYDSRFREAFVNELNAFVDTVLEQKPWPVAKEDVIIVQQVASAAKESLETDRVVQL
ncbi:myo-inositol 2-dehydrogenase [Nitzschia inconspicua]|uniref:Myo-inositol 2-dehydrogenase n=1 Tax=Nitzschia inconspicua TaxID=303405 RepID=A0A9K3PKF7_9STRA|nr:myo-inositol 2-dehydrogenase [Nitzschia inconspicua]